MRFIGCLVAAGIALGAAVPVPSAAQAQAYPNKPIKVILGYGAGGVADVMCRLVGQKLSVALGQQVIIDNRPGAGQIAAAQAVAKADPDGYTLLALNNGNAISASLFKSLPYDTVNDFAPIAPMGYFGIFILANKGSRFADLRSFIAEAKKNPGKLSVGATSIGSTQNLSAELFKSMAGIDVIIVPFKSTPELITALNRDDLQAAFESPATTLNFVREGQLKALAITSNTRMASFPDIPTVDEGGVPRYQVVTWNGFAAPAKTPRAIIDRLNKETLAAVADPDIQRKFAEYGIEVRNQTPEQFREVLLNDIVKWRDVIKAANIEPQ
jgi:tripartite-type tricarboxylate transporter receptor subunit TctC